MGPAVRSDGVGQNAAKAVKRKYWDFIFCSASGPLGGVKNLRVTDPTMTSLNVKWEPADGAVRQYKVFFVPTAGGTEDMVGGTGFLLYSNTYKISV